jgi:hypothetical protein
MHGACGVIDTACTVHAVSMTPNAIKNFRTTSKSKNQRQNIDMMHDACGVIESLTWPWQPLKGISIKNIYVPELSYPTTKKNI